VLGYVLVCFGVVGHQETVIKLRQVRNSDVREHVPCSSPSMSELTVFHASLRLHYFFPAHPLQACSNDCRPLAAVYYGRLFQSPDKDTNSDSVVDEES
jgi:hypothetical protein